MSDYGTEQFLYLTTTGRTTGLLRQIEIWFVERDGRLYCLSEHGAGAHWVRNIIANPSVTIRMSGRQWRAVGRVLELEKDPELYMDVRALARTKYDWGDGLPVEFRLEAELDAS